jgi:hypothetical protein
MTEYGVSTHNVLNYDDDGTTIPLNHSGQYWNSLYDTAISSYFQCPFVGRSVAIWYANHVSYSNNITASIDGVASSTVTHRDATKGSLGVSTTRNVGGAVRGFVKNLEFTCSFVSGATFNISETQGLRTNQKVIVQDKLGNREEGYIASFVADTSFTLKKNLSVIASSDVDGTGQSKLLFGGFHVVKSLNNIADEHSISCIEYEPLPLEWSVLEDRVSTVTQQEIKELNYVISLPISSTVGFSYPFHSDGEQGTALTSEIEFIKTNFTTSVVINRYLQSAQNTSASVATSVNLNIRSRRNIATKQSLGIVRG